MAWLPHGEKISKISLFVLAQLTNVTDGQTDGRTDGHRMPAIAALCIATQLNSTRQRDQQLTQFVGHDIINKNTSDLAVAVQLGQLS